MGEICEAKQIRVVIVDDHPMLLEGTRSLLACTRDIDVVGTTTEGAEALALVGALRPDVLILDVRLPDVSGIEVARRVRELFPEIAVLILTGYDDVGYLRASIELGVRGYLRKSASGEEIISAVRMVAKGKRVLEWKSVADAGQISNVVTSRELDVLRLLAAGCRNSEIAGSLGVSSKTVEFHISNLLDKLGARSRTEAVSKARQHGLMADDLEPS